MSRLWKIVIPAVILALLVGTYFYLKNRPKKEPEVSSTSAGSIEISKFDKELLTKMVVKNTKGTLVLEKRGTAWVVPTYPYRVKLREMSIDDMAYSFASLYAERVIDKEPKDLAPYGLAKPQATAEATLKDGTVRTFYLGDATPAGNTYYLMAKGDPKVYSVWMNHGLHFNYDLKDLRETKFVDVDATKVVSVLLKRDGKTTVHLVPREQAPPPAELYAFSGVVLLGPYTQARGADSEKLEAFYQKLLGVEIKEFVADSPPDLGKYGLAKPKGEIWAVDQDKKEFHLLVGSKKNDELTYVMEPGIPSVFAVSTSTLSILDTKAFDLADKFAFIINIDNVEWIEIQARAKTHTISMSRKTTGTGDQAETVTTFRMDGAEVKDDIFRKYYQKLVGLMCDAEKQEQVKAAPEVKITYHLNFKAMPTVKLEFSPYNRDFYAFSRDGVSQFVVSRSQVSDMLDMLDDLAAK